MKRIVLFLLLAVVLAAATIGCKNSSDIVYRPLFFDEQVDVDVVKISDSQFWGGVVKFCKVDNYLVAVTYQEDIKGVTWLHVFDTSGRKIADYIPYGRGPNELVAVRGIQVVGHVLKLYDLTLNKEIQVDFSASDGVLSVSEASIPPRKWMMNLFSVGNNKLIYSAPSHLVESNRPPRLLLESPNGVVLSECFDSPFESEDPIIRFRLDSMGAFQSLSPDGSKFAIAYSGAGVLELYSVGKSIKRESLDYFSPHDLKMLNGKVVQSGERRRSFCSLYASDKYVFASYDGSVYDENKKGLLFKNIAVFDWKGHALKLLKTLYRIEAICYSEDDHILYTVNIDESGDAFLGKLDL